MQSGTYIFYNKHNLNSNFMNTNQNGVFRKEWLKAYAIVSREESKIELEVTSAVTEKNLIPATVKDGKTIPAHYIVNLKAIAVDKMPAFKALLEKYKNVEQFPIEETAGLFLTASIFVNSGKTPELPMKNERVHCSIGTVKDKEGAEVLRVTSLNVRAAAKATNLLTEFADLLSNVSTGSEILQQQRA
jgi:hypothetical protein